MKWEKVNVEDPWEGRRMTVIFDIDGVITIPNPKFVSYGQDGIEALLNTLQLNRALLLLISSLAPSSEIVLMTARPQEFFELTKLWLERNRVSWDYMFMRDAGDDRADFEVKESFLAELMALPGERRVAFAIDDNAGCVEMFRRYGILTFHV